MNFIDQLALRSARLIRAHNANAASERVLFYALSLLINSTIAIFITLIICMLTGHLAEALLTIGSFLILRYISGGFHFTSSLVCCIFTILLLVGISHIEFEYLYLGLVMDFFSIMVFYLKAPYGIENVSRLNPKYYPILKFTSIIIVCSNFIYNSSLLSFTFFVQAVSLSTFAASLLQRIERKWIYEK